MLKFFRGITKSKVMKIGLAAFLVAMIAVSGVSVNDKLSPQSDSSFHIGVGQKVITIGSAVYAAGTVDYTTDGVADDVQFQAALDALPVAGGKISVLTGGYVFSATVTRAIANVTIVGNGASSNFTYDGVTPIFTAGGNNWVFSNLTTDAGSINMGATTGWMWTFVNDGTFYAYRSPYGQSVFNAATVASLTDSGLTSGRVPIAGVGGLLGDSSNLTWTNPSLQVSGANVTRTVTYMVAASDAPAYVRAQADYIADGTDDDVEINAALASLPASGGVVALSEGTFTTTDAIQFVSSNVTLQGVGWGSLIDFNGANTTVNAIEAIGTLANPLSGIRVSGLRIEGTGITQGSGIYYEWVVDSSIYNVYIYNVATVDGEGGVYLYDSRRVVVDTVWMIDCFNGFLSDSSQTPFVNEDITVINSVANTQGAGDAYHPTNGFRYRVLNNYAYGAAESGIDLFQIDNSIIQGNVITTSLVGIEINTNSEFNVIANNTINNTGTSGIQIGATLAPNNNTVMGNVVTNAGSAGIYVNAANSTQVIGNYVYSSATNGIFINNSSRALVSGNMVYDSTQDGIAVNGADATVVGNSVYNSGDDGYYAAGSNGLYTGNSAIANVRGINAAANTNSFIGNYIKDNTDRGIRVDNVSRIQIVGNSIINNTNYGVYLYNTDGSLVEGNSISGQTYGVRMNADADNNSIISNLIWSNTTGIDITNANSEDNLIYNNNLANTTNLANAGTGTVIRGNRGYVSENSGVFTITAGLWGASVNHGLATNATAVQLTLSSNSTTQIYVLPPITTTAFSVNLTDLQGSDITGYWRAVVGAGN